MLAIGITQYSSGASTSIGTSAFSQVYQRQRISFTIQSNSQCSSYVLYNLDLQLARLTYICILLQRQLIRQAFQKKAVALLTLQRLQTQARLRAIVLRLSLLKMQTLVALKGPLTRLQNQLQTYLSQNAQLKGVATTVQLLASQRVAYIYNIQVNIELVVVLAIALALAIAFYCLVKDLRQHQQYRKVSTRQVLSYQPRSLAKGNVTYLLTLTQTCSLLRNLALVVVTQYTYYSLRAPQRPRLIQFTFLFFQLRKRVSYQKHTNYSVLLIHQRTPYYIALRCSSLITYKRNCLYKCKTLTYFSLLPIRALALIKAVDVGQCYRIFTNCTTLQIARRMILSISITLSSYLIRVITLSFILALALALLLLPLLRLQIKLYYRNITQSSRLDILITPLKQKCQIQQSSCYNYTL